MTASPARSSYDYNTPAHRQWAARVLARDETCRHPGCHAPATQADHIKPIAEGGAPLDLANGQGLCHTHHSTKTARENGFNREPRGKFLGRA